MRDILFKCSQCSKSLAVSDAAVGGLLACPDCSEELRVPAPAIDYQCGFCGYNLCSPEEYAGEIVVCPACEHDVTIPQG